MALSFPEIDPVAFAVGPVVIRWYALAYIAGFLIGWRVSMKLAERFKGEPPTREHIDDFLSWAIIGVIIGGRLGYVLFYNPVHYYYNLSEVFQVWKGGMSFHGGVLGLFAAILLYVGPKQIHILRLSDVVCAVAPIGLFFGRMANFINAELYGRVTASPLGMIFPGSDGLPRHPSQLYEAALEGIVLCAVIMVLIVKYDALSRKGFISAVFLFGYGASRFFIEMFREPDAQIGLIGEFLSMGQILTIPMIFIGVAMMVHILRQPKEA
ncbi:MAG: prolipoprotein diacylglyceryl transferase [Alphaproteobacteria bacterium]|nr:prolipoprotein diacylglyceryl transferase [Alphaproteobacteria bacterium]